MLKYLSLFFLLSIFFFLFAIGCSKPILKMPEPLPPIVKMYKHLGVYGNRPGMQNTGVYLREGDAYSLFGTGKITTWPRNPDRNRGLVQPGWRTIARIGEGFYFRLTPSRFEGFPLIASESGKLYIGIEDGKHDEYGNALQPRHFDDNAGFLSVDIIVWEREDWGQFTDFFEKLKKS